MTEAEHERAVELTNEMLRSIQGEVNRLLKTAVKKMLLTRDQEHLIRTLLSEQARFWE